MYVQPLISHAGQKTAVVTLVTLMAYRLLCFSIVIVGNQLAFRKRFAEGKV